jgi:uncharacterized protein (UPF0254 family)
MRRDSRQSHSLQSNRLHNVRPTRSCCPALDALEGRLLLTTNFTYNGGPLLAHVGVENVYFGPTGQSVNTAPLDGFITDVTNSRYMDMLGEYNVGRGSFINHDVTSTNWSTHQIVINGTTYNAVDDSTIQSALAADIANGRLQTPDSNRFYVVNTAPNVVVSASSKNSVADFLGYHSTFLDNAGHRINYAVIPNPAGNADIAGLSAFQQQTEVTSHELAEGVTDPIPGSGWYNNSNNLVPEIGDIVNQQYGFRNINGSAFNRGYTYVVQRIWSNQLQTGVLPVFTTAGDYDGDNKTDRMIFDQTTATFYIQTTTGVGSGAYQFGNAADRNVPVSMDYDGDGRIDRAIFDQTNATFYIQTQTGVGTGVYPIGDPSHVNIPLPGDYDGDGKTDRAIFDQTTATFYIQTTSGVGTGAFQFGDASHRNIPFAMDLDGDGKTDLAIFDQTTATFYIRTTTGAGSGTYQFGNPADHNVPVVMDYDGDGRSDLGLFDQTNATFYIQTTSGVGTGIYALGNPADHNFPVGGDFDGDGKTDRAIFDQTNATYYIQTQTGVGTGAFQFGNASHVNIPVPATITGTGSTTTLVVIHRQGGSGPLPTGPVRLLSGTSSPVGHPSVVAQSTGFRNMSRPGLAWDYSGPSTGLN